MDTATTPATGTAPPVKRFTASLLAVIVVYQQRLADSRSFQSLRVAAAAASMQVDLFVYDNSPAAQSPPSDPAFAIHYRHDPSNPGVSKAYNAAADFAAETGKTWMLLLDQDTMLPPNTFAAYAAATNMDQALLAPRLWENGRLYSPCRYFFGRGFHLRNISAGSHSLDHRNLLNSGLCIRLDLFERAGRFNEKIPLYFSDFEFINRVRHVAPTFAVVDLDCQHTLADVRGRDLAAAQRRFRYYAAGAATSAGSFVDRFVLACGVGLRALKLTLTFGSVSFMGIFLRDFRRRR